MRACNLCTVEKPVRRVSSTIRSSSTQNCSPLDKKILTGSCASFWKNKPIRMSAVGSGSSRPRVAGSTKAARSVGAHGLHAPAASACPPGPRLAVSAADGITSISRRSGCSVRVAAVADSVARNSAQAQRQWCPPPWDRPEVCVRLPARIRCSQSGRPVYCCIT